MQRNNQDKTNSSEIGIYWGTFDPPTLAHIEIIKSAVEKLNLQKLIVVINDDTKTGKPYRSPGHERLKMLRMQIPDEIAGQVSILRQTDANNLSYDWAKTTFEGSQIHAIVGQDSFEKYGKYCASYDTVQVVPRGDNANQLYNRIESFNLTNTHVLSTKIAYQLTSSTLVRDAVSNNQYDGLNAHLDENVGRHIQHLGLFKHGYDAKQYQAALNMQRIYRRHVIPTP